MPFRAIQPTLDSLLRFAPHKMRMERERQQADEVYKSGHTIRVSWNILNMIPRSSATSYAVPSAQRIVTCT